MRYALQYVAILIEHLTSDMHTINAANSDKLLTIT